MTAGRHYLSEPVMDIMIASVVQRLTFCTKIAGALNIHRFQYVDASRRIRGGVTFA